MYERRKRCESDTYHTIIRGNGRVLLFEDDQDRSRFMDYLDRFREEYAIETSAWCLMANHVHLLLHGDLTEVARFMESIQKAYVRYFNRRHEHVGHLTQGRYKSIPIESDSQLMETVRYIHKNPVKAGIVPTCAYDWSSYLRYFEVPPAEGVRYVLDVFGDVGTFRTFHSKDGDEQKIDRKAAILFRLSETEAKDIFQHTLKDMGFAAMPISDKQKRDEVLCRLKRQGCSIRQIERLTGIGRSIIARSGK